MYNNTMDLQEKRLEKDDINTSIKNILGWSRNKGFLHSGNLHSQMIKLFEELGEFSAEVIKCEREKMIREYGDILTVLVNIGEMIDTSFEEALLLSYTKIKDRAGRVENGTFIKDK